MFFIRNVYSVQNLATVSELEGITKEQPGLVEIRNVGSWVIHRCYNCSVYTHAVHREYGAALVLINSDLVVSINFFFTVGERESESREIGLSGYLGVRGVYHDF